MDLLAQLFVNGLINGSHYALLGAGFGLIFATTRIVHFAYGPIFTAAAYAAWFAANVLGLPIAAAMLFAALVAAALGTASYQYLYLPFELRQSSSHVALIASLGLFIVLENLIAIVFGTGGRVVDNYQYGIFLVGPVYFSSVQLGQVITMIVLTALLGAYLARTRHGKAILATTDNPEMARIIGIDTVKVSRLVFAHRLGAVGHPSDAHPAQGRGDAEHGLFCCLHRLRRRHRRRGRLSSRRHRRRPGARHGGKLGSVEDSDRVAKFHRIHRAVRGRAAQAARLVWPGGELTWNMSCTSW